MAAACRLHSRPHQGGAGLSVWWQPAGGRPAAAAQEHHCSRPQGAAEVCAGGWEAPGRAGGAPAAATLPTACHSIPRLDLPLPHTSAPTHTLPRPPAGQVPCRWQAAGRAQLPHLRRGELQDGVHHGCAAAACLSPSRQARCMPPLPGPPAQQQRRSPPRPLARAPRRAGPADLPPVSPQTRLCLNPCPCSWPGRAGGHVPVRGGQRQPSHLQLPQRAGLRRCLRL
jgi:hypothetical protein